MQTWKSAIAILVAGGFLGLSSCTQSASKTQSYEMTTISRGTISSVVSSNGTLAVVSSVSVLAQMSGRVEKVNVDYNTRVKKGEVLATINTDLLKLQAKAAQAAVDKAQANYDLQVLAAQNAQALAAKGLLSDYDLKSSLSTLQVNKAELASAKASLEQIETEINQYAFITSPIDGIVLERDIDPGESVVGGSSSTSTSLFTLAQNLAKMQIKAEVDELDISSIHVGQAVTFTVEANPGETFSGTVKEIRLVPETSDNVVYYYVIILADNKSGTLLPGMTASVNFIKQKKENILLVSSAALRFTPANMSAADIKKAVFLAGLENLTPEEKQAAAKRYDEDLKAQTAAAASGKKGTTQSSGLTSIMGGGGGPGGGPGGPPGGMPGGSGSSKHSASASPSGQPDQAGGDAGGPGAKNANKKPLWYLDDAGKLAVILVDVGVSDGLKAEVSGAEGLEGRAVIQKVKVE